MYELYKSLIKWIPSIFSCASFRMDGALLIQYFVLCLLSEVWPQALIYSTNLILKTELLISLWLLLWGSPPQDPSGFTNIHSSVFPKWRGGGAVIHIGLVKKQGTGDWWKVKSRETQYETHGLILHFIFSAVRNDSSFCKSGSMILSDIWKMRNAQLMTCVKNLVSVAKDGLNRLQDKSESNSANLVKRPSFLFLQLSFLFLFHPFHALEALR